MNQTLKFEKPVAYAIPGV